MDAREFMRKIMTVCDNEPSSKISEVDLKDQEYSTESALTERAGKGKVW